MGAVAAGGFGLCTYSLVAAKEAESFGWCTDSPVAAGAAGVLGWCTNSPAREWAAGEFDCVTDIRGSVMPVSRASRGDGGW